MESLIVLFLIFCAGVYLSLTFLPDPWKKLACAVFGIGAIVVAVKLLLTVL